MSTESTKRYEDPSDLRFEFGKNWQQFLSQLDEGRLANAETSLKQFWPKDLEHPSFLDIGSGSGTFSLAAWKLGAEVFSFDYDPHSVACTRAVQEKYAPETSRWQIEAGSILDPDYVDQLGQHDIVYSWGVLHHTGAMWQALDHAARSVKPGGLLVIAIYNDQGWKSRVWTWVKRCYCSGPVGRFLMTALFVPFFIIGFLLSDILKGRNPFGRYRSRHDRRGMSVLTDIIDWIGGYPFEVASAAELKSFYAERGFELVSETLTSGLGCNEFAFRKTGSAS